MSGFPETELGRALSHLAADRNDASRRMALYVALSRSEVFLLLDAEPVGDTIEPRVVETSGGRTVVGFDSEMRLAGFAGKAAYAAVPGRVLVPMLAESDLTLVLNLDADEGTSIEEDVIAWLATVFGSPEPLQEEVVPSRLSGSALTRKQREAVVPVLEQALSGMPGLTKAVLCTINWLDGRRGHVLALAGVAEQDEAAVARAVAEAMTLSGARIGTLDVMFPTPARMDGLWRIGLRLSPAPYRKPDEQVVTPGANPGLDPARPPKLR